MDYQEELKRLQDSGNYWKPKVGQYKIKALSELENADPYVKKKEGQVDEVNPQIKISIFVEEKTKIWTFGIGKTPASTYGQLIALACKHANQLKDVEFSVVVKNDGTKNDYTIVM